jgi:spoIIIJ-associated protein
MTQKRADSVEFTAKTIEEALAAASGELGVPAGQLEYTIVRDSTRTIFGLVRTGEVTIRVTPPAPRRQASVSDVVARLLATTDQEDEEPQDDEDWVEEEGDEAWDDEAADGDVDDEDVDEDDLEDDDLETDASDYEDDDRDVPMPATAPRSRERQAVGLEAIATEVVTTLLDKMDVMAAVEVSEQGGEPTDPNGESSPLVLNLVGDDLGVLIGRRGETLRDLQFIARLIVSRRMGAWPNLVLDVEGYKSRRTRALRLLAKRVADQVRRTHQSVVLEAMPANERRIVHLALRDDPDVYTESTGEDEARKVQILPKRER